MTTYRDRHLAGLHDDTKLKAKAAKEATDKAAASTKAAKTK